MIMNACLALEGSVHKMTKSPHAGQLRLKGHAMAENCLAKARPMNGGLLGRKVLGIEK